MAQETGCVSATLNTPLLTVCVPTYNRAGYLRVMLQALLPQVRECQSEVEVWILDNCSTDETASVLEQSRDLGPFKVFRQPSNVGPTRNIIEGPVKLASGEFSWVLGDHNLLKPHGLQQVVDFLLSHRSYEVCYINFLAASYPEQWPETALAGHEGSYKYVGNQELPGPTVQRWDELLKPLSAACTQNYVHIARTSVWKTYWSGRSPGPDYTSAETTYPHTVTILRTVGDQPAAIMMQPVLTIFNGAQSWNSLSLRLRVYFRGLADLLKECARIGLPRDQARALVLQLFRPCVTTLILDCYSQLGRRRTILILLQNLGAHYECYRAALITLPVGLFPAVVMVIRSIRGQFCHYRSSYLYNCRPARWIRSAAFFPWKSR